MTGKYYTFGCTKKRNHFTWWESSNPNRYEDNVDVFWIRRRVTVVHKHEAHYKSKREVQDEDIKTVPEILVEHE